MADPKLHVTPPPHLKQRDAVADAMRDVILALAPPYFRCIGRESAWTPLRYYWRELASLNLGRL